MMIEDNEFDAAARDMVQGRKPGADPRVNLGVRRGMAKAPNPDAEAELRRAADIVGVDYDTARGNVSEVKSLANYRAMNLDTLPLDNPAVADFLTNPDNAALAHDEIGFLGQVENQLKGLREGMTNGVRGILLSGVIAADSMPKSNKTDEQRADEKARETVRRGLWNWDPRDDLKAKYPDKYNEAYAQAMADIQGKRDLAGTLRKPVSKGYVPVVSRDAFLADPVGKFLPAVAEQGLQSVPFMFSALAAPGATAVSQTGTSAQQRAENDGRQNATVGDAAIAAPASVAITLLDRLGSSTMLGVGAPGRTAIKEMLLDIGKTAITEGATEGAQQLIQDTAEGVGTNKGLDPKEMTGNFLFATATGAGIGGGIRSVTAPVQALAERQAASIVDADADLQAADKLDALHKMAAQSKLRERSPATFQDFVARATEDGPAENLFVDPQALMQAIEAKGLTIEEVTAALPSLGPQLAAAGAAGTDLRIPTAEFMANAAGSDLAQELLPHLKTDPNGMSRSEAEAFMEGHSEQLKTEIEKTLAAKTDDDMFQASREVVRQAVQEELQKVGRFSTEVNTGYSELTSSYIAARAALLGMTPEAFYDAYGAKIVGQQLAGTSNFGQLTAPPVGPDGAVTLHHWSLAEGLTAADPGKWGENIAALTREERNRISSAPGRTYYGIGRGMEGGYKKELSTGKHLYATKITAADLYDYAGDPQGFVAQAVQMREGGDYRDLTSIIETLIRDAGFKGYWAQWKSRGMYAAVFDSLPLEYQGIDEGKSNDNRAGRLDQTAGGQQAEAPGLRVGGGIRRSAGVLDEPSGQRAGALESNQPLHGAPGPVNVPGRGKVQFGPFAPARRIAADYMAKQGWVYRPPTNYVKVDPTRAKALADAFDAMEHAPDDPTVKAAYRAMIDETIAQWQAIKATGLEVEVIKGDDPYAESPRLAILDVIENNHLWVFPTTPTTFGGSESADVDITGNPLLEPTGEFIGGHELLANDVFRIVHDYFGHIKDGNGFRADGEENAWQAHAAMYSPLARRAMTTETRGQNSWVNFGPFAESNKTANAADTQYAPQKIGLLPEWASNDGADWGADSATPTTQGTYQQSTEKTGETTGVVLVNRLASAARLARNERFPTGRALKVALQERALKAQAEQGIDLSGYDDETAARLSDYAFEDALEALEHNSNAIGWYDRKVTGAKTELAKLFPEIATDPEAEFAFIWALAVTSNGLKVDKNFELAAKAYEHWKNTGAFPENMGIGQAAKAINDGLAQHRMLVEQFGSWEAARDFMVGEHTVRDIEKATGIGISGEGKGEKIRGAGILGPKIGNGFFSNLYGYFDALTMDRWLMRSVGRWRGTLIETNSKMIAQKQQEIRELFAVLNPQQIKGLQSLFKGSTVKLKGKISAIEANAIAEETAKRSQDPAWRSQINKLEGGEALRTKGNGLAKYLDGQVEQPAGTQERAFLRKVFRDALARLQKRPGLESLTMADLQAVLWYPEKLLYESAKKPAGQEARGYEDDDAPDYENAARKLVRDRLGSSGQPGDPGLGAGGVRSGPGDSAPEKRQSYAQGLDETLNPAAPEGWGTADGRPMADVIAEMAPNVGSRGTYNPSTATIALLARANLSTFIHESGHYFLDTDEKLAALLTEKQANGEQLTAGEQQIVDDFNKLLAWFGIKGTEPVEGGTQEGDLAQGVDLMLREAPSPKQLEGLSARAATATGSPQLRGLFANGKMYFWPARQGTHWNIGDDTGLPYNAENRLWFGPQVEGGEPTGKYILSWESGVSIDALRPYLSKDNVLVDAADLGKITGVEALAVADAGREAELYWQEGDAPQADTQPTGRTPLETWRAMSIDEKRVHHEKFARGFEAYAFEGKAPSLTLQSLFNRFRGWLLNVYRSIAALNVELNDEVRSVMDRMLASTAAIKEAEAARSIAPLFANPEDAGMTADQWREYQEQGLAHTDDAVKQLQSRSLRDMQWLQNARSRKLRELQRDANERRKAVRKDVTEEVMAEQVNRARQYLKRGEINGEPQPEAHKLNLDEVKAMLPDVDIAKVFGFGKYGMVEKDGYLPDVVAEMFGYTSGEALVQDLATAESAKDKIEGLIDQRMLERYGDLTDAESIARAADEAIHNEAHDKFVATEAAALARLAKRPVAPIDAIKAFASNEVARQTIRELRPDLYAAAAARAARAAEKAFGKGDVMAAAKAKQDQLVNSIAARIAYAAKAEMSKMDVAFRRVMSLKDANAAKTRDLSIVNAARAILSAYGYGTRGKDPVAYMGIVANLDPDLYAVLQDDMASAMDGAGEVRDMTVERMRAVRDIVGSLMAMSKRVKEIEIDGKRVSAAAAVAAMTTDLDNAGVRPVDESRALTDGEKFGRAVRSLVSYGVRMETWADLLGKGFTTYMWNPVSEANTRYLLAHKKYIEQFTTLLKAIEPTIKTGKIEAPELGYTFSGKLELLHAVLHTGNESNMKKLLLGRRWGDENTYDGSLDTSRWDAFLARVAANGTLTKADFDFAQSVWDLLEDTKPAAQKAHLALYGRYFDEVEAKPVQTPFGEYRGGYVPALTDPNLVTDAAERQAAEAFNDSPGSMMPSASNGFTKGRVENYTRQLALDLRLIPAHIDKVLKFSYLAPAVADVGRLLKHRALADKIHQYDPRAMESLITPWLTRSVKQVVEVAPTDDGGRLVARVANIIRQRTSMQIMALNITNTLQQITGFSLAAIKVKPAYLLRATWASFTSPKQGINAVRELSDYMKTRNDNQAHDMRAAMTEMLIGANAYQKFEQWMASHAFFMQQAFANVMEPIIWHAAHAQALDAGATPADAVREADSAVRTTQGASRPVDVSRIETGTPLWRLMTMFTGYFNMQANLVGGEATKVVRSIGLKRGAGKLAYLYMIGIMMPAVVAQLITEGMRGGVEDQDEDGLLDDYLKVFFGAQIKQLTAFIPLAGQPINTSWDIFARGGKSSDAKVNLSPVVSQAESAAKLPFEYARVINGDGNERKVVRDTMNLMGVVTGLPLGPLGRVLGYGAGVGSGDIQPTGPIDATRGFVTGNASADSKQ